MGDLRDRKDIPQEYKWDLGSLYENLEAWESDFVKAGSLFEEIKSMKGAVLESAENLLALINVLLDAGRIVGSLATYAKMRQDENTNDSEFQALYSRAESFAVKFSEVSSFFVPEIMSGNPDDIEMFLKEKEELKLYKQYMDDILRNRPHTLSDEAEEILAQAGEVVAAPQNIFGMLSGADLKFPTIKGDDGEDVTLTHGSFIPCMMSKNRDVRKEAFKKYYSVFNDHKNTFGALVAAEVKKNIFNSKARKFGSAREAALFVNNVPVNVYDNLIDAVNENLPAMHKYIQLRKKVLGVEELHPYDVYVPLLKDVDMKVPYEDAKGIVLESLKPLGNGYTSTVENSYTDGWIDVYENVGKRSGAYSWGTYDSKPYILLNYHDKLDDMFTLTHEMGHSMHSDYSKKNQPYVYGNYSIFVAEVASTTNEALLNHHLLETVKDKGEKLYILNHYLEQFRGTIFRQTMFAEYERDIHAMAENGEALTAEVLCAHYRKLNEKYFGKELVIDSELDLEWAKIPHFYYNFYVFQYATGFASAIALSQKIINEGEQAVKDYIGFLSAGCSDYPIEVLKKAGVDMTTSEPVDNALKLFGELVDEMEKLLEV